MSGIKIELLNFRSDRGRALLKIDYWQKFEF